MKHGLLPSGNFWFLVDDQRVAFIDDFDLFFILGQGFGTITLQLTADQVVRIENDYSRAIYGSDDQYGHVSWFTGYLVHKL